MADLSSSDHRFECWSGGTFFTPIPWHNEPHEDMPGFGEITLENLKKVVAFVEDHIRTGPLGRVYKGPITRARVVNQRSETVVVEWAIGE